jgi:hypothetical protein
MQFWAKDYHRFIPAESGGVMRRVAVPGFCILGLCNAITIKFQLS